MKRPVIAFRTDGGRGIGLGHLRRCVTLAQELQKNGAGVHFAVEEDQASLAFLRKYGFMGVGVDEQDVRDLKQTQDNLKRWRAHALIIDSYSVPEQVLAERRELMVTVIDDLADRQMPVDLVVNGAANARELPYRTSSRTRLLLGPEYALLREEFSQEPHRLIQDRIERVLITVGGVDPFNLTPRLIAWTLETLGKVQIDVFVGPFFTRDAQHQVKQWARGKSGVTMHMDPSNVRELMLACDLAISGGGQTCYELATTGAPTIAIRIAENQTGNLQGLSERGALAWVGDIGDHDLRDNFVHMSVDLACDPVKRKAMAEAGRLTVDGYGAQRVASIIMEMCGK